MYQDPHTIGEQVKRAYGGDLQAAEQLRRIEAPHASSPDRSQFVLVQPKYATRLPDGRICILNRQAQEGEETWPCADIYRHFAEGGSSWMHIPIPRSFRLAKVEYEADGEGETGRFVFVSVEGRRVKASAIQMGIAFRELDLVMGGAEEAAVEEAFGRMEQIVAPPPPVKRTGAENPPIEWKEGSVLVFEPELQRFAGLLKLGERKVGVSLYFSERHEVLKLLPALDELARNLPALDESARLYAAEELLDTRNDFWIDEEEGEVLLTAEEFASQVSLESVELGEKGRLTFWYDDGELFAGHTISVERGADGAFVSADMMG